MWMDDKTKELKERIIGLSDDELLNIVEVEFDHYRKEALDFARAELMARVIDFEEPFIEQKTASPELTTLAVASPAKIPNCARCGARTRPGVLLGEKEITMMFSDKDEQRFVEVHACTKCGQVQLVVDLETEVVEDRGPSLM
jgi:hypothetical protein